jgi:hypothetical protein
MSGGRPNERTNDHRIFVRELGLVGRSHMRRNPDFQRNGRTLSQLNRRLKMKRYTLPKRKNEPSLLAHSMGWFQRTPWLIRLFHCGDFARLISRK